VINLVSRPARMGRRRNDVRSSFDFNNGNNNRAEDAR
jgi:hypothetical protein